MWYVLDYPCSLRLKAELADTIAQMEKYGEIELGRVVKEKLLRISRATIDRLLSPLRRRKIKKLQKKLYSLATPVPGVYYE